MEGIDWIAVLFVLGGLTGIYFGFKKRKSADELNKTVAQEEVLHGNHYQLIENEKLDGNTMIAISALVFIFGAGSLIIKFLEM